MQRGIIAQSGIFDSSIGQFGEILSPDDIRYYLLYWDKIVIPIPDMVHIGLPDEEILLSSGAIERPVAHYMRRQRRGVFGDEDIERSLIESQGIIAEQLMSDTSTDWVIHQIGDKIYLPDKFSKEFNSLKVALTNVLPVPNSLIPIEDVLEFKLKRKDELVALHDVIDQIYFEILQSPDPSLKEKKAISDFKKSIADIEKISKESFNINTSNYSLRSCLKILFGIQAEIE